MKKSIISLDTPIEEVTFTVLDTETTGVNPDEWHEIIEIGMAHFAGGEIIDTFETLIRPSRPQTKEAAAIHRIPREELDKAPPIEDIINDILRFIGDTVIAAHNLNFDMTFLHTTLRRLGRPITDNLAIDTILLSMETWPQFACHCLICLGPALNLPHKGKHRAQEDVFATSELLDRIISELDEKGKRTLGDLHPSRRDYTWGQGDVHQEMESTLRCAINRKAPVDLYLYNKDKCLYFRNTVLPIELSKSGILRARAPEGEEIQEFPFHNMIKVSPVDKEQRDGRNIQSA